jgi:predicted transcriptional regulator
MAEDPAALFFELAHAHRLRILQFLAEGPQPLKVISSRLGILPPEALRHLQRLVRQRVVERIPAGGFALTGYGQLVAEGVGSFAFLSRRREFFLEHDLAGLPPAFLHRLAELSGPDPGEGVSVTLRHVEGVLSGAEEYAWFLTDQAILKWTDLTRELRERALQVRVIFPASERRSVEQLPDRLRVARSVEFRYLPTVPLALALNERMAGVAFRLPHGDIDYSHAVGGDQEPFHRWCLDLFRYYWERPRPSSWSVASPAVSGPSRRD